MSYYCTANFKQIPNDVTEIQRFFAKLKTHAMKEDIAEKIIEENSFYCPLTRIDTTTITKREVFNLPELEYWLTRLFSFPWRLVTYNDVTLLCVLGVPTELETLFDATIHFQNSSDQDYARKEWHLDIFKSIYDKWKYVSKKELIEFLDLNDSVIEDRNESYYRRTAAYQEIAMPIEELLYARKATRIQLFTPYDDLYHLNKYKQICVNLPELQFKEDKNAKTLFNESGWDELTNTEYCYIDAENYETYIQFDKETKCITFSTIDRDIKISLEELRAICQKAKELKWKI